jgi:hypothetical protein
MVARSQIISKKAKRQYNEWEVAATNGKSPQEITTTFLRAHG